MDPVSSLIGSLLLGFGVLLLVGAVKNRRVLGKDGILTTALAKGSITSIADAPQAFPLDVTGKMAVREESAGKQGTRGYRGPDATADAVTAIGYVDVSLANGIGAQLESIDATSSRAALMPLAQLLAIANAKGLTAPVAAIRAYVKGLTDETI